MGSFYGFSCPLPANQGPLKVTFCSQVGAQSYISGTGNGGNYIVLDRKCHLPIEINGLSSDRNIIQRLNRSQEAVVFMFSTQSQS